MRGYAEITAARKSSAAAAVLAHLAQAAPTKSAIQF